MIAVITVSFVFILISYSTFASDDSEWWVGLLVLTFSIIVGLAIGYLFNKYQKIGKFFLGAWGGFSLGILLYNAVAYLLESQIALWCFAVGIGVLSGVLIVYFDDEIIILATAIIGSLIIIMGIGLVVGGFTNPFLIAKYI
jgi:hypothetical protein